MVSKINAKDKIQASFGLFAQAFAPQGRFALAA